MEGRTFSVATHRMYEVDVSEDGEWSAEGGCDGWLDDNRAVAVCRECDEEIVMNNEQRNAFWEAY